MKHFYLMIITDLLILSLNGCATTIKTAYHQGGPEKTEKFTLVTAVSGANWQAVKYLADTGEAWILYENGWKKIADPTLPPTSHYIIKLVATSDLTWQAIRMNPQSGKSWMIKDFQWIRIK